MNSISSSVAAQRKISYSREIMRLRVSRIPFCSTGSSCCFKSLWRIFFFTGTLPKPGKTLPRWTAIDTKNPAGLVPCGLSGLQRTILVSPRKNFGLAESEQSAQSFEINCFFEIQLWIVYLNVYQLLDIIPRSSTARITNVRR